MSLLFNQKKLDVKKAAEQPKSVKPAAAPSRQHAAGRRSQRAAATIAKSYREPDTDDSQSESEKRLAPKARDLFISCFVKSLLIRTVNLPIPISFLVFC